MLPLEFSRLADYDEALIWYQRYQLILGDETWIQQKTRQPNNVPKTQNRYTLSIVL